MCIWSLQVQHAHIVDFGFALNMACQKYTDVEKRHGKPQSPCYVYLKYFVGHNVLVLRFIDFLSKISAISSGEKNKTGETRCLVQDA